MTALGKRLVKLSDRFYDRMRDPAAFTAARAGEPQAHDFAKISMNDGFRGRFFPVGTLLTAISGK